MRRQFNPTGLIIALLGFFLTRSTVTFALAEAPVTFVVGGVLPLLLGLALSVFGVALAVGSFENAYVRTIALWTVLGTATMGVFTIATVYGNGQSLFDEARTVGVFSNLLIGGSVGGALTGLYAAQSDAAQRELMNRKNRLVILNRLLHDRVMNAITVIKGTAPLLREDPDAELDTVDAILTKTHAIEDAMSSVRDLAEPGAKAKRQPTEVDEAIKAALEEARAEHPDASFVARDLPTDLSAYANHRLSDVIYQLLANGAEHANAEAPKVTVRVNSTPEVVTVSVADKGPGLPALHREALEQGTTISNHGDPTPGLGLYLVRLFVHVFGGTIEADVTDAGTTVSLLLDRADGPRAPERPAPGADSGVGAPPKVLGIIAAVALLAGLVMGAYVHLVTGSMPVIGALYGTESALVGGLTHLFHSLVFGLIYAGILVVLPERWLAAGKTRIGVGVAWSLILWLVASGIIMPVWLNLVGIPTPIPNLSPHSLLSHLLWGLVLGGGYHLSQAWR
jgi:signal transduction histidine kinase